MPRCGDRSAAAAAVGTGRAGSAGAADRRPRPAVRKLTRATGRRPVAAGQRCLRLQPVTSRPASHPGPIGHRETDFRGLAGVRLLQATANKHSRKTSLRENNVKRPTTGCHLTPSLISQLQQFDIHATHSTGKQSIQILGALLMAIVFSARHKQVTNTSGQPPSHPARTPPPAAGLLEMKTRPASGLLEMKTRPAADLLEMQTRPASGACTCVRSVQLSGLQSAAAGPGTDSVPGRPTIAASTNRLPPTDR